MARKVYEAQSLEQVPPIEFELAGEVFHVPRKQSTQVMVYLAVSERVVDGEKTWDLNAMRNALSLMLAQELFIEGEWVPSDDITRFWAIVDGGRFNVPVKTLGMMVGDLLEEIDPAHPTGGPSSSPTPG